MIFSRRYHKAIKNKILTIDVAPEALKKISYYLNHYNDEVWVTSSTGYQCSSSALQEAQVKMELEIGGEISFEKILNEDDAASIFDIIELFGAELLEERKNQFQARVNETLEFHQHPWHLSNGEFFKIDQDFMGARLILKAQEHLTNYKFSGALAEYQKAREELMAGQIKGAIGDAGQSFESAITTLTGLENSVAKTLIKEMELQGYFDDLPRDLRASFGSQVLMAVPFMRNKFKAAHGQGSSIVDIPKEYGELCINLTAAFHCFFVSKYLKKQALVKESANQIDDDVPF